MHDKEAIDIMHRCLHELEQQRRQIDFLTPRADAYEIVSIVARGLQPRQGVAMSGDIDIIWRLRKKIEELQPKPNTVETD